MMMNQQMPNMRQPSATMYSNGGAVPMQAPGMQMGGAIPFNNQQQMMMGGIGATGGTPMMDPFLTMTANRIDVRTNQLPDPFGFTKTY